MAYFDTCPACGATLDPGERCGCTKKVRENNNEVNGCYCAIRKGDNYEENTNTVRGV